MPKSRNSSIAGTSSEDSSYEVQEMGRRMEERMEGITVDVPISSRSRGGMENIRVTFGSGSTDVLSESGSTYQVDIDNESCSCPDYVHRHNRCRHIEAVSIARGMAARGMGSGNIRSADVSLGQTAAETQQNQNRSELQIQRQPYREDGFFYNDNVDQFREDSQRLLREPLPYYYENVLNGSDITFGIELEFVNGNSNAIAQELYGMGLCCQPSMVRYHSANIRVPGKWILEADGSVTNGNRGGELVSPVLRDTPQTWRDIQRICEVARQHGGQVNFKTGGHIHIGAEVTLDGKRQRWKRFFKMTAGFEDVFHRLAGGEQGVYRGQVDSHYTQSARPQSHRGIQMFMQGEGTIEQYQRIITSIGEQKYRSINLLPFGDKKTVEFRAFNGTLTPEIIQANVKYAAGLVNAAERSRTRESENFNVTEYDKRRGGIINHYAAMEGEFTDQAIMNVLDTVCSRKEDKEQLLAVIVRNRWVRG